MMINQPKLSNLDIKINPAWLPDSMQPIIDIIGLSDVLMLIDQRGGTQISVPPNGSAWPNALRDELDADKLKKLSIEFGGLCIDLPSPVNIMREIRNHAITEDILINSLNHNEIAKKYGMSRRWAIEMSRRIKNSEPLTKPMGRPADMTIDLFA